MVPVVFPIDSTVLSEISLLCLGFGFGASFVFPGATASSPPLPGRFSMLGLSDGVGDGDVTVW